MAILFLSYCMIDGTTRPVVATPHSFKEQHLKQTTEYNKETKIKLRTGIARSQQVIVLQSKTLYLSKRGRGEVSLAPMTCSAASKMEW